MKKKKKIAVIGVAAGLGRLGASSIAAGLALKGLAEATPETERLRQREDLTADFKRIVGNPTEDDLQGFGRLPTRTMKAVNDFLLSGFKLKNIKTFTIWTDHQPAKDGAD